MTWTDSITDDEADMASRAQYYHTLLGDGCLTVNEVRELEDRNSIGPEGDISLVQVNQIPLESMRDYAQSITGTEPDGEDVQ